MSVWKLPDDMIQRAAKGLMECHGDTGEEWGDFELDAIVELEAAFGACDACEGSGQRSLGDMRLATMVPCSECHGAGLAGVREECTVHKAAWNDHYGKWSCVWWVRNGPLSEDIPCVKGLVLVIPLERSSTDDGMVIDHLDEDGEAVYAEPSE